MQTQTPAVLITGFTLSVTGLVIHYVINGESHKATFCPKATAEALKVSGMIEDWTTDEKTLEPVLLYRDSQEPQGYNGQHWHEFVKGSKKLSFLIPAIKSIPQDPFEVKPTVYGILRKIKRANMLENLSRKTA